MQKRELDDIVDEALNDLGNYLPDSDEKVCSAIAITNAEGVMLDEYDIIKVSHNAKARTIVIEAIIELDGDNRPERPICGTHFSVPVTVTLKQGADSRWERKSYTKGTITTR